MGREARNCQSHQNPSTWKHEEWTIYAFLPSLKKKKKRMTENSLFKIENFLPIFAVSLFDVELNLTLAMFNMARSLKVN